MDRFDIGKVYFFEDGKIFDRASFMVHADYDNLFSLINTAHPPHFDLPESLSGEVFLQKAQAQHDYVKPKTTEDADDRRMPPSEPSGIRMLFRDE